MRLTELEPEFLQYHQDERGRVFYRHADGIKDAEGIMFLCPKCFKAKGGSIGVHAIICWSPVVPEHAQPRPGRWNLVGDGFHNLSLVAGSSSVQLHGGCEWHGFVQNGEVKDA